jgi:hypothetical protein
MPPWSLLKEIRVEILDSPRVRYRICRNRPAEHSDFRSNHDIRKPPRLAETRAAVLHMAVSMFETPGICSALIDRTGGRIGMAVAEVLLPVGHGVCVAKTGGPGHWSVWADAAVLLGGVHGYKTL